MFYISTLRLPFELKTMCIVLKKLYCLFVSHYGILVIIT